MKKVLSLLLAFCACFAFVACEDEDVSNPPANPPAHTHEYASEWSKDATHHWYACTGTDCTEVKDKAEHTWNGGEITTPATSTAEGVKTFTCTACGQAKIEPVAYVPTKAEIWSNAFDNTRLTNYTLRMESALGPAVYKCAYVNGNHTVYISADGEESYVVKTSDGKYVLYELDADVWTKTEMSENEINTSLKNMLDNMYLSYTMLCPNFGAQFNEFTYNESTQIYEFNGTEACNDVSNPTPEQETCATENERDCPHADVIRTNSILESWQADYYYATVKLTNGNITQVCVKMSGQNGRIDNFYFENYGTTIIELPTVSE